MITKKDKIPTKGDSVEKVLVNKNRTICDIIFGSGKVVRIDIDPSEFGIKSTVKTEAVRRSKVDAIIKNTPEDQEYQNRVLETLGRMSGMSKEEIAEQIKSNQAMSAPSMGTVQVGMPQVVQEDFEAKKDAALKRSEARSERLAKELAVKSGAKLEGSFKSGQEVTISQG